MAAGRAVELDLLEAKNNVVTLRLKAVPHRHPIVRRSRGALSIRIQKNGVTEMLLPGMRCAVEYPGGGKETVVIRALRTEGPWLFADCGPAPVTS